MYYEFDRVRLDDKIEYVAIQFTSSCNVNVVKDVYVPLSEHSKSLWFSVEDDEMTTYLCDAYADCTEFETLDIYKLYEICPNLSRVEAFYNNGYSYYVYEGGTRKQYDENDLILKFAKCKME